MKTSCCPDWYFPDKYKSQLKNSLVNRPDLKESCPAKTAYWVSDEGWRMVVVESCIKFGRVREVEHPDGWSGNGKGSLAQLYHLKILINP